MRSAHDAEELIRRVGNQIRDARCLAQVIEHYRDDSMARGWVAGVEPAHRAGDQCVREWRGAAIAGENRRRTGRAAGRRLIGKRHK